MCLYVVLSILSYLIDMEDSHACVLFWSIICWNYALDIICLAGIITAFMLNMHCFQQSRKTILK